MKLRGEKYPRELVVGAMIADRMALLYAWVTGAKEKPQLLTEMLFPNENEGNKEKADVFESFEAFRAEYDRLTRKDE